MFMGPSPSTESNYKHLPLLVHRFFIVNALEWLILNHPDYEDASISHEILSKYPEDAPPVSIIFKESKTNKVLEHIYQKTNTLNDNCRLTSEKRGEGNSLY